MADETELPALATPIRRAGLLACFDEWHAGQYPNLPSFSKPFACALIAQWCVETGAGARCFNWNIGNVRWTKGCGQHYQLLPCSEVVNGHEAHYSPPDMRCAFRAFATVAEGVEDYLVTLERDFPDAFRSAVWGDPVRFVLRLAKAHYYTALPGAYAAGFVAWLETNAETFEVDPAFFLDPLARMYRDAANVAGTDTSAAECARLLVAPGSTNEWKVDPLGKTALQALYLQLLAKDLL